MSKSTHQIEIRGVDKTGAVFNSIKDKASAAGMRLQTMLAGGIAAAAAYMGISKISQGVDELGKLSDVATAAGLSVAELTKTANALDIVGVASGGVEGLAKTFQMMERNTGRTGLEGFLTTIEEIGKIEDVSARSQAAVKAFGRSGMEFMPLINGAKNGTEAIRGVIGALPGVSDAAARAGDEMSDAKKIGAQAFHSIWLKAIGAICGLFHGDMRGGMASMGAYAEYGAAMAWRYMKAFFTNNDQGLNHFKLAWGAVCDEILRRVVIMSATCYEYIKTIPSRFLAGVGGGIMAMPALFSSKYKKWYENTMRGWTEEISNGMYMAIDSDLKSLGVSLRSNLGKGIQDAFSDVDTSDLKKRLEETLKNARNFERNHDRSTLSSNDRRRLGLGVGSGVGSNPTKVSNSLILGGSNEMRKLQILGPGLQNEQKKTNQILEKISGKLDDVKSNQVSEACDFDMVN